MELMAHFSMLEMAAKPKHPINICDDSANEVDKAETNLIQKVFIILFSVKNPFILSKDFLLLSMWMDFKKSMQQGFTYTT